MVKLDQINLSKEGITKFFSPIEAKIMETLWDGGEMFTSQVTEKTEIPLTSVAGTLDRLVKAGYVKRRIEKVGGRVKYLYTATFTQEEAAKEITTRVLDSLVDAFGEIAVENFYKYGDEKK